MIPITPAAGTLYWSNADGSEPWRRIGETDSEILTRAAYLGGMRFSADRIEVISVPLRQMSMALQLTGVEARRMADTLLGLFQLDPKWQKEQRRYQVAEQRIGQQMRHVRRRAARRARRAA